MPPRRKAKRKEKTPVPQRQPPRRKEKIRQPSRRSRRNQGLAAEQPDGIPEIKRTRRTQQTSQATSAKRKYPREATDQEAQAAKRRPLKKPTTPLEPTTAHARGRPGGIAQSRQPQQSRPRTSTCQGADTERIGHWARNQSWPATTRESEADSDMAPSRQARPNSHRKATQQNSGNGTEVATSKGHQSSVTGSSSTPGIYKKPQFRIWLQKGTTHLNCYMRDYQKRALGEATVHGPSDASKNMCKRLRDSERTPPQHSRFYDDDAFLLRLESLTIKNEASVTYSLHDLICPSAEELAYETLHDDVLGSNYAMFVDHWGESWVKQPSVLQGFPVPKPDYCAGFSRKAFSEERLARLDKVVGEQARFAPTSWMYFPFLTCEAKSYRDNIIYADNQNAHSMMLAIHATVELFRGARCEHRINREILGFSVSYNNDLARVWAHYPVVSESRTEIYQKRIFSFLLNPQDNHNRWMSWNFIRNIYEHWAPKHFQELCEAIDNLDPDWGLPETGSTHHAPATVSDSAELLENLAVQSSASTIRPNVQTRSRNRKDPSPVGLHRRPGGRPAEEPKAKKQKKR